VSEPLDTTFDTGQIMDTFGVRTRNRLRMNTGAMQPVAVLADMSKSFAPQRIEARGISGNTHAVPGGGFVGVFELESRGPGGIVIEQITLQAGQLAVTDMWRQNITATGQGGLLTTIVTNQGGVPVLSVMRNAFNGASRGGTLCYAADYRAVDVDIFVPGGSFWSLQWFTQTVNSASIVWREIPEPLGEP